MKYCKLDALCRIQYGFPFDSMLFNDEKGTPLVRIRDVVRGVSETYTTETAKSEYLIQKDDILIGMDGEFNVAKWKSGPAFLNQRVCKIIPSQDTDKDYLFHFLPVALKRIEEATPFVTVKHLSAKALSSIIVPFPEARSRTQISSTLNTIHDLLELRKYQLKKIGQLASSRFVEVFGDLEKNPRQWNIARFNEFALIDAQMTTDYEKYANYPHIGIDSIEKGSGILIGYRTVKEDNVISGKYIFTEKHIIYSKIRPNLNKVALPSFSGLCSADAYPILPKENCSRTYLAFVMRSEYFLRYIVPLSGRSNMPKVNRDQIRGFSMPLPPLALQNEFAAFVEQLDKSKVAVQESIRKLEILYKAKLQEYFG